MEFIRNYNKSIDRFNNDLSSFNLRLSRARSSYKLNDINIGDLVMTDVPPQFSNVQKDKTLTQELKNYWKDIKTKVNNLLSYMKNKSSHVREYLDEEFSMVVKKFLWDSAITRRSWWSLIFDEALYREKIAQAAVSIRVDSDEEIDYEFVQKLILNLEKIFQDYNTEFQIFDIALSIESKSFAHVYVLKKLVEIYGTKLIEKAENEHHVWESRKSSLCQFFISQLSPDQNKDKENARQCLRLFSEKLQRDLTVTGKTFVKQRLKAHENQFNRLKMQESRDSTLTSLSTDQLYSFVLNPTDFLVNDFNVIWKDFEMSLNKELKKKRENILSNFENLKESFSKLYETLVNFKESSETFQVQNLFQITQNFIPAEEELESLSSSRSSLMRQISLEIMNISHLKGRCASDLIFSLIGSRVFKRLFSIETQVESM